MKQKAKERKFKTINVFNQENCRASENRTKFSVNEGESSKQKIKSIAANQLRKNSMNLKFVLWGALIVVEEFIQQKIKKTSNKHNKLFFVKVAGRAE